MKKMLKIEFYVKPKNLEKVKKLFEDNKDIFERVLWTKVEVKVV